MRDEDEDKVGYGKPPKATRFKRGQASPCPDGGWNTKRRKQAALRAEEELAEAEVEKSLADRIVAWASKKRQVQLNGVIEQRSGLELAFMQLQEQAMKGDPKAQRLYFSLMKEMGLLKPGETHKGGGVLVVYPVMEQDQWIKCTEGERLPKDPLHGTAYAGGPVGPDKRGRNPP